MISKIIRVTFFVFLTIPVFSQVLFGSGESAYVPEEDFEIWSGITLKKNISKKIRLYLQEEIRFNNNALQIKRYLTDVGGRYELNDLIRIGLYYRFSMSNRTVYYEPVHKIYSDVELVKDINRFGLKLRGRIQYARNTKTIDVYEKNIWYNRNEITVEYNIRKTRFTPFIEHEQFIPLNNPWLKGIDKYRLQAGTEIYINPKLDISVSYLYQRERNLKSRENHYILITRLSYKL